MKKTAVRTCAGPGCTAQLPDTGRGRPAVFCSGTCRARAHRQRNTGKPRPAGVVPLPQAAGPAGWDPPSQRRGPYETAEPCPDCAGPLTAGPRGTRRMCRACQRRVTPPGVSAPYERSEGQPARQVRSQRERDAERRDVAERKAVLAGELRKLLDTGGLDDGSAGRAESYLDDVRAAGTMARLDELVEEFQGERLRKRGWFGGRVPAEIGAGDHDEDQDDGDDDGGKDQDQAGDDRGWPRAIPAAPPPVDYAAELAIRNYQVNRDAPPGQCQITELRPPACPGGGPAPCGAAGRHAFAGARVCQVHHAALSAPMAGGQR